MGMNDFTAIHQFRDCNFFKNTLGINKVPSEATLRQRMDEYANQYMSIVDKASQSFLISSGASVSGIKTGHIPLDIDVFPMDNSRTKKEGVEYTYKGHDGYAPIAAYLGREGWNLAGELRNGSCHSQNGFIDLLDKVIPKAKELTSAPLLVRLDSAHDALENMVKLSATENVDYIIKWNPRSSDWAEWQKVPDARNIWKEARPGKEVAIFTKVMERAWKGKVVNLRLVVKITKRTIEANGQMLNFTDGEMEGWWTSLALSDEEIIALYDDHGTSEQFHSEIKSDLDLERLPSGKFKTNDLVLSVGFFVYNMARWIGLKSLLGEDAPVRHPAKRRRVRTVIQEIINVAARFMPGSRQLKLRFGRNCPVFKVFGKLYRELAFN